MHRLRTTTLCASAVLLAAMSLQAADDALSGYVPPGSRVVIGIRVRNIADAIAAQDEGLIARQTVASVLAKTPLAGFDPLRDVDELLLASTGEGENPPALVVMSGRFNATPFSSGGQRYRNARIFEMEKGTQQATAILDDGVLLAGDLAFVRAALDRDGKGDLDPALAARIAALRGKYDIWGAGDMPSGAALPQEAAMLQSIDRFDFGMSLSHGLECVADLHVRSQQDMEKLNASLQMLRAMFKAQPSDGSAGRFELESGDNTVHLSLAVPEEALKKAVAAQRPTLAAMTQRATQAKAAPAPTRPPAWGSRAVLGPEGKALIVRDARGLMVNVKIPAVK